MLKAVDIREQALKIDSGAGWLHGFLHEPGAAARGRVLICPPIFEERKSAHRALVEAARHLAAAGWRVLRFDYRGCGDSGGAFADYAVRDWEEDTVAAAARLQAAGPADGPLALLGLRLGGSLALRCAVRCQAERAVLWEPVVSGHAYLRDELRKKLMKEMVTFGRNRVSRDALLTELANGATVDFDGYPVTPRLQRELEALDPETLADSAPARALLMHVSHRDQPAATHAALRAKLEANGCRVDSATVVLQPFWNLIGYVDIATLADATLRWCDGAAGG